MEYSELEKVNKKLKKTDIKGKDYIEVNQRILGFRQLYPNGSIETEILNMQDGTVTIKAIVKDNEKILATGHAQEKEGSSFINKVSYIENCETSAVGRALGILGIGADTSVRSFDEMQSKEFQVDAEQIISTKKQEALKESIQNNNLSESDVQEVLNKFNYKEITEIKIKDYGSVIEELIRKMKK